MPVDLTVSGATLKKIHHKYTELINLAGGSRSSVIYSLCFLDNIDCELKYIDESDNYAVDRLKAFIIFDVLALLHMYNHFVDYPVYKHKLVYLNDIEPLRERFINTGMGQYTALQNMMDTGINKDNSYQDNFNDRLCFTKHGIILYLCMINNIISEYKYNIID